jgi:hypothetical protein
MKITLWGFLFVLLFALLGWNFADSVTMPRTIADDDPNLYELTRQTAFNTRLIVMLLFMFTTTAFAIVICRSRTTD